MSWFGEGCRFMEAAWIVEAISNGAEDIVKYEYVFVAATVDGEDRA